MIMAIFILILGCVCPSTRERNTSTSKDLSEEPIKPFSDSEIRPRPVAEKKYEDVGDFVVQYANLKGAKYSEIDRRMKDEKILEDASEKLNKAISLPKNISLQTKECEEINAFYDPKDSSITVCYELMEHFFKLFRKSGKSESISYDLMFDATRFVFLHELGHALIDVHEIPIAGGEEDAADRLSTYICLEQLGEDGANSAIAAAQAFSIESKDSKQNLVFYDNHKLGQQRFYDIMCSLYGYSSTKYGDVVKEGLLPKDRAISCVDEYKKLVVSWSKLLSPLRKN
jgi:Putative metallopeptidase